MRELLGLPAHGQLVLVSLYAVNTVIRWALDLLTASLGQFRSKIFGLELMVFILFAPRKLGDLGFPIR